jgi:hypothetical protein
MLRLEIKHLGEKIEAAIARRDSSVQKRLVGAVSRAPERELAGGPETDLRIRINRWCLWPCGYGGRVRSVDEDGCFTGVLLSGGGLEFHHQLGGHPATVFYLDALGFGPLADFGGVHTVRRSPASASCRPASSAAGPARSAHITRKRVSQCLGVLLVQVDLVLRAVQPETDRSFGGAAVKVIDE